MRAHRTFKYVFYITNVFADKLNILQDLDFIKKEPDDICINFVVNEKLNYIHQLLSGTLNNDEFKKEEFRDYVESKFDSKKKIYKNSFYKYEKMLFKRYPHLEKMLEEVVQHLKEGKKQGSCLYLITYEIV